MSWAQSPSRSFRYDINGLRAVAVAAVVLYHFGVVGASGGFVGVDCFFVISGFLMTQIIDERSKGNRFSFIEFYQSRASRIVPALALMVTTVLALGFVWLEPGDYKELGSSSVTALLFISDWKFALAANYFNPASERNWLLHTWSLSVEWQFYLLYPVALRLLLSRAAIKRRLVWVLVAGAVLSLGLNIGMVHLGGRWATLAFFVMPARVYELLIGGIVYLLSRRRSSTDGRSPARTILELAGLSMILCSVFVLDRYSLWPSYVSLVPSVGTAFVIYASRNESSLLRGRPLQTIGRCSYSIYLWHWPLAVLLVVNEVSHLWTLRLACIGASVAIGALSFRYVELPAQAWLRAPRDRPAVGWPSLAAATAAVLLFAFVVAYREGLPSRGGGNGPEMLDAMAASNDWAFPVSCSTTMLRQSLSCPTDPAASAPADVIVLGDSHAQMLFPYARKLGINIEFVTNGGCVPVGNVERIDPAYSCGDYLRRAREYVFSSRAPRILFASVWTPYFDYTGTGALGCVRVQARCDPITSQKDLDDAFAAFYADVGRLVASGRQVAVLLPLPVPNIDVPRRLRTSLFFERRASTPAVRLDDRPAAEGLVREALLRARDHGAIILDPRDVMCADGVCPVVEDGRSLYKDGNHIRPFATERLAPLLRPFLLGGARPRDARRT